MIKQEGYLFPQFYIYIYVLIMYSNILSWNTIEKKTSGHVRTRTCVTDLSQETCYDLDHHASPKKDASIPELIKQQCFYHSSNVNSHTMTDTIFVMSLILLYRCLYINYIYSHKYKLQKNSIFNIYIYSFVYILYIYNIYVILYINHSSKKSFRENPFVYYIIL